MEHWVLFGVLIVTLIKGPESAQSCCRIAGALTRTGP